MHTAEKKLLQRGRLNMPNSLAVSCGKVFCSVPIILLIALPKGNPSALPDAKEAPTSATKECKFSKNMQKRSGQKSG